MILTLQPKAFVITIKDHAGSERQSRECIESGKKFNWKIEKFYGTPGNILTIDSWKEINVTPLLDKPSMNKAGTWGCFFSHYRLWNLCVEINEPIIVLEHDAVIKNYWPEIEIADAIVKLFRRYKTERFDRLSGVYTKSTHAYCILPTHCQKLINFSKEVGAFATDAMMGSNVVPIVHHDPKGTSLVEGNHIFSTTQNI